MVILWGNVGKRNDCKDQKRISQNYVSAEIQHEIGHSVGIHMVRGLYFKILLLRYDRIQTFYRPEVHQFRVFKQKPNSWRLRFTSSVTNHIPHFLIIIITRQSLSLQAFIYAIESSAIGGTYIPGAAQRSSNFPKFLTMGNRAATRFIVDSNE